MKRRSIAAARFTLIECLVVIGIVLLCATLMVPAIAATQARNQRADCLENLNGLGMAMESYCSDYSGYFPCKPAYGAASATYDKDGGKVAMDRGLFACRHREEHEALFTNQVPCAKFSGSENCGIEDEMCIAFGANVDPEKRRVDSDDSPCQTAPVGLGYLMFCGYLPDLNRLYCPAWEIPATRFRESCGPDMCPDGSTMGNGQINTLAAAQELGRTGDSIFRGGNYYHASVLRARDEAEGWYVKGGALGVQSSYVYRNQAVRQLPGVDDQAKLPVYYAQPTLTTGTGCPSFKTQKLLGGRSLAADTFLRSNRDVKNGQPGYAFYHHKDGYNVLYGDWHAAWYDDTNGAIKGFVQGPKGDGKPVTSQADLAPFDAPSARCGTAAGIFVDSALNGAGQVSGRAAVYHLFDLTAGIDQNATPLPQ
jgi:hypothetical protein